MNRRRVSGAAFAAAGCLSLARFVLDPGFTAFQMFNALLGVGLMAVAARQLLAADGAKGRQRALVVLLLVVAGVAFGVGVYVASTSG